MQQGVFRRVVRAFMCCGLAFTLSSALTSCDRIRGTVSGPPVPVIEIETDHFFMGEIESDAIAEVFVKVFNRGESPLAITKVTTECPCTKGEMLEPVIPPGGEGILRVTVDPKRDTPQRLTQYADAFGADEEQWLFLTGDQRKIYHLIGQSFGLTVREETGELRKPGFEITHSTRVVHVDAAGHIRGKYDAQNDVEMAALARALEKELARLPQNAGDESHPVDAPVPPLTGQAVIPSPAADAKGQ